MMIKRSSHDQKCIIRILISSQTMTNKTIMITSIVILTAAISVATTMMMVQANPIGDEIRIHIDGVPAEPNFVFVIAQDMSEPPEYQGLIFAPDPTELTVDVDDGMIWIMLTPDPNLPPGIPIDPFTVNIENLDWLQENGLPMKGEIVSVGCDNDPAIVNVQPMASPRSISIFIEPFTVEPIEVHCEYLVDHFEPGPPSIHVLKFADLDGNGVQDPGEDGIEFWVITLDCIPPDDNDDFGPFRITDTTNDEGLVWFENIPITIFCVVSEELRDGWTPTTPTSITVDLNNPGDEIAVIFGNTPPEPASIHVLKFADLDGDGLQGPGEEGIAGWEITLQCEDVAGNIEITFAETDAAGMVWFENIPAFSECIVFEELREGWTPTTPTSFQILLLPGDEIAVIFGNTPLDFDGDGIANELDDDPAPSSQFSDIPLGGTTFGTVIFGSTNLSITDNPANGVNISSTGAATVDVCGTSSLVFMAGSSVDVSCGSITIEVVLGSVDVTFVGDDGTTVTSTLT